jgi:hypothetical protein
MISTPDSILSTSRHLEAALAAIAALAALAASALLFVCLFV